MTDTGNLIIFKLRRLLLLLLSLQISFCAGQVNEKSINETIENGLRNKPVSIGPGTAFPQIHTNLNGIVREFVRTMHQDKRGDYWFGTNGDGIIRYDGQMLQKMEIEGVAPHMRVLEIVEDKIGNVWFGTSDGLIKYDGEKFETYSMLKEEQGAGEEIWGLTIDRSGLIWMGWNGGVSRFDGENFTPFLLPDSVVENPQHMLSDKLVFKILEDRGGAIWLVTDGNGIFKYNNGEFFHLTTENGLTDNSVFDIIEDKQGNIWIGTFYGGVSMFNGTTFINFTKDGIVEGLEVASFYEDSKGNVWFAAEGYGVYRYDGVEFKQFTTESGLTANVVQSIFEDDKGQLWFGTWQGLCIFDGEKFVNAKDKEFWTN